MKSTITNFVAFALLALIAAGCNSGDSKTVVAADGTKGTEGKDGGMSVESNGTKAELGGATTVTEADLKMAFYPGSTEKPNSTMKVETATEKSYLHNRLTADEPQKVADFYTAKDKDLKFTSFGSGGDVTMMASKDDKEGGKYAITIIRKKDAKETEISMGYGWTAKK